MLIKSPYATTKLMAIVVFDLSVTILEIFAVESFMTLTLTFRTGQCQMLIWQSKGHMRLPVLLRYSQSKCV